MVLSGYLMKIPYWTYWQLRRLWGKLDGVVFYVESGHDYRIMEHVLPYIAPSYKIVARNKKIADKLTEQGIETSVWPAYPSFLIMARHAFHRFPVSSIKKIGMRHGPYHFKRMIDARKYNAFDLFLFTSQTEVSIAVEKGIHCGIAGGYPRLDALRAANTPEKRHQLKVKTGFDNDKKNLLFTATWDKSGMSAIDLWVNNLQELTKEYNVMVSLHPGMGQHYISTVKLTEGVLLVDSDDLPAHMVLADFLISDTSSVIAEFCALNKPIITFRVPASERLTPEIQQMIGDISLQITDIAQVKGAVNQYLEQPDLKRSNREKWNKVIFDDPHVSHGARAAEIINDFIARHQKK